MSGTVRTCQGLSLTGFLKPNFYRCWSSSASQTARAFWLSVQSSGMLIVVPSSFFKVYMLVDPSWDNTQFLVIAGSRLPGMPHFILGRDGGRQW
jgi:hypothetical protein